MSLLFCALVLTLSASATAVRIGGYTSRCFEPAFEARYSRPTQLARLTFGCVQSALAGS